MRLIRQSLRGVTRFTDTVTINYDKLPDGLIAFVGSNGAGKSTLMEAAVVALWKLFPSRNGFYENFHGQDAFVEATFRTDADAEVTVRLAVNAVKKTTEGYVLVDGAPVTDGKSGTFQASIEKTFGSVALFLASVFACQTKKGSFLGLPKGERKDMFVDLLRLGMLQVLAEEARARAASAEITLTRARDRVADIDRQLEPLAGADDTFAMAESASEYAREQVALQREHEAEGRAALDAALAIVERRAPLQAAASEARAKAISAGKDVESATAGVAKVEMRKTERLRFLEANNPAGRANAARAKHSGASIRISKDRNDYIAKLESLPDLEEAEDHKAAAIILRDAEAETIERAKAARQRKHDASTALDRVQHTIAGLQEAQRSEIARLTKQSERLTQVPCTKDNGHGWIQIALDGAPDASGPHHDLAGTCPLLADARAASGDLVLARNRVIDLSPLVIVEVAYNDAVKALEAFDGCKLIPDRTFQDAIDAASERVLRAKSRPGIQAQIERLDADLASANSDLDSELSAASAAVNAHAEEIAKIHSEYEADKAHAADALTAAQERLTAAHAALGAAEEATKAAEAVDTDGAQARYLSAKKAREASEFASREADQARARAQAALDRLAELEPQAVAARGAVVDAAIEVGDWSLLEKSLGRDGVQALEVDAAGPEVATICNDLLTACYGPRFSLTLETLAEKRDGGKKEVFDIKVFDGGAERPVENLSGGEKIIVSEALGLALAIFNARKNDLHWRTLWRDETAGSLDPENAQAYVRMLRRARELGGFHQILFVAHQPEVWEAADAQIHVADGVAYVQGEAKAVA